MGSAIRLITTGGTIDDIDFETQEQQKKAILRQSLIPKLLEQSRVINDIYIVEVFQRDSRFITDEDRELLYKMCIESLEDKIIITHGSFTMSLTAKFLGQRNIKKTIILTGSIIPANKENSDALFNLGFAVHAVQTLEYGVYVAMNSQIFTRNNVRKNIEKGIFETEE